MSIIIVSFILIYNNTLLMVLKIQWCEIKFNCMSPEMTVALIKPTTDVTIYAIFCK